MINFQEIEGIKIAYWMNDGGFVQGRKNLVFIHGSGGDHTNWQNQYKTLADSFNIVAVDLPGHGQSGGTGEKEVGRYVEWIRKLIEATGLNKPVLTGHSLGAAISLTFAIRHGGLLSGIIPVGGGVTMPVNPILLEGLKKDAGATVATIVKFSLAKENREKWSVPLSENLLNSNPEVTHGDLYACDKLNITEEVAKIRLPVLVVCGADDKMTPPANSQFLKEGISGAKLALIPGAGHFVMMENAEAFNKAVKEFVQSL
ncbi:MAG TPA: alpha/beta hydrolase [Syntrophales bacterium]|mgnify:CR=1 FL=1|nr:alpha/beta hydrolase [Syntrophales bacterium]